MTLNNNTKNKKSQYYGYIIASAISVTLFVFTLFVQTSVSIKLILAIFIGLIPIFILKSDFFLYSLFLLTPSIRTLSKNENIFSNDFMLINFNAIINFLIIVLGILLIIKKRKEFLQIIKNKIKPFWIFIFFILLASLSFFYSFDKINTLEELTRLVCIFFIFIYSFLIIKNKKHLSYLIVAIIIGALLPAFWGLAQFFWGSGWWDKTIMQYRIYGTFLHPATFAFYLLFTLPIIYVFLLDKIKRGQKFLLGLALLLFSFLMIATLTRGAWVGFLVIIIAYGILKNRKFLIASFLGLIICYLLIPPIQQRVNDVFEPKYNSSFTTRIKIVKTTLPAYANSPFFGYGYGTFENIHLKYNEEARTYESLMAHNDYLRILIELGIIGLIIYLGIFFSLFVLIIKLLKKTNNQEIKNYLFSLILLWLGALAISTGDNLLRTMPVQFLLWSYTGAVLSVASKNIKIPCHSHKSENPDSAYKN